MAEKECFLKSQLWVPTDLVTPRIERAFTYKIKKVEYLPEVDVPKACINCDLWGKKWRPGKVTCEDKGYSISDVCSKFSHRRVRVSKDIIIKTFQHRNDGWSVFARGDLGKVRKHFGKMGIEDQTVAPKLPYNLVCHRKLYDEQDEVIHKWLEHGYGILQAGTGWGKTVTWAWLVAHLGLKTILLAQEVRHLMVGFEGLYEHTNIAELEEEAGEHLIGVINKDWKWAEDKKGNRYRKFLNRPGKVYPITFSTFQSLASKRGIVQRKKLKNEFGVLWCEEAHHQSAPTFHQATRVFNTRYRGGQTATPSRKDETHVAIFDTIGPVTAQGTTEQMVPKVFFHTSNVLVPDSVFRRQYAMVHLHSFLAANVAYRDFLYDHIVEDIENDRNVLVITERKNLALDMQMRLGMEGFGCELMMGGMALKEQDWYAERLLSGEINVIIGTKVVDENVNIPPWDSIHLPFPNFSKEREEQRVGRIRRHLTGANLKFMKENDIEWEKPQPIVHVYMWHANNDMPSKAINFRRRLYNKWKFDFDHSVSAEIAKKKIPKTMKGWLKEFEDD